MASTNLDKQLSIEIVGIFRAINPNDPSWFYSPKTTYEKEAWIPLAYFESYLPTVMKRPQNYTSWYTIVDPQSLRYHNSMQISKQMTRFDANLHLLLNSARIDYSPASELQDYESRMNSLILLFYIVGAPLILLALIFISLTATVALQQEDQEIATMRGRGVSFGNLVWLNLLESLVLVVLSLPFALLLGWLLANLMGQTQLFLVFTRQSNLAFSPADINPVWIAVIAAVIFVARLIPVWGLRHTSVINLKQQKSRTASKPFWERFFIDFILLAPAIYAYLLMQGKVGTSKFLSFMKIPEGSGQSDPLMFLASSLFAISFCMIMLRAFPLAMRLGAFLSTRFKHVGTYLAIQEISRRPREHTSVMLLVMVSLTLAIFSASVAKTLDQWFHDSQYYNAGADLVIDEYELPIASNPQNANGQTAQQSQPDSSKSVQALVSLEKHLAIPGIQSATYVGNYSGQCTYGGSNHACTLMGIDRLTFPLTAYYRSDFSSQSLGAMMNALAANPYGILVPQAMLDASGLKIGDRIHITSSVGVIDQGFSSDMTIVGTFNYFPTVTSKQLSGSPTTIVLNMGTLFGVQEAATNYDVWLDIANKSDYQATLEQIKDMASKDQLLVNVKQNTIQQIQTLLDQPEWVGLFGILSVGFLLTCLMACIGFVLDTFASLRKHYIQLGIMQALGLSTPQLVGYLVLERVVLMTAALISGTIIGLLTSMLFVPILQFTLGGSSMIPPFQVLIGWQQSELLILLFAVVLLATIVATILYLVRIKIFQAVKMGETI